MEFVEVSVVKYQQKAAAIRTQTLDGMWHSRREKPQVSYAHVADKAFAVLIHRGDARGAIEHDGPFRFHMPMEFADPAGREPHFHARHGGRNRQFAYRNLACPA